MKIPITTIKDAIENLLNNRQLTVDEAADRHFDPTFRQRTNGSWDDRPAVVARIALLRHEVERATIRVVDELADGDHYAERHVIDLVKRDGERIVQRCTCSRSKTLTGVLIESRRRPFCLSSD